MKEHIRKFKDQVIETMVTAFEIEGKHPTTTFFLIRNDELLITVIPCALMATNSGKDSLVRLIKAKCKDPDVKAVAFITEIDLKDNQRNKTGDGIMVVISCSDGDEISIYNVDCDRKKVLEQVPHNLPGMNFECRFSGFFENNNN